MDDNNREILLKKLNFDAKDEWLLYDENLKPFFSWFFSNIDANDNVLSDLEISEYKDLQKAGRDLTEEELDVQLKIIEKEYPGLLTLTDDDIQDCESHLKMLESEERLLTNQLKCMNETETHALRNLEALEREQMDAEYRLHVIIQSSIEKSKILSSLQSSTQNRIIQLNQCYLQTQNPPLFVYQMPIDQYNQKCVSFVNNLEVYMKKNFNLVEYSNDFLDDLFDGSCSDLLEVNNRIADMEKRLLDENMKISGMECILEKLENDQCRMNIGYQELREKSSEIESDNVIKKLQLDTLNQELKMLVDEIVLQRLRLLIYEHSKNKPQRAIKRLEKIVTTSEIVDNVTVNCEMLWILLQLDLDKLKNKIDNSDEMFHKSLMCSKRIIKMQSLSKVDVSIDKYFHKILMELLLKNLPLHRHQLTNIKDCLQEYAYFQQNLTKDWTMIADRKKHRNFDEEIKKFYELEMLLHDFVFKGPTNDPQLFDPKFMEVIHEKKMMRKSNVKEFTELKETYQKEVHGPLTTNKIFRCKEFLWIWFLSEPKKVIAAIKEVESIAAKQGTTNYKALGMKIGK
ncbi:unnamed protein product [Diamesa serratosioi]